MFPVSFGGLNLKKKGARSKGKKPEIRRRESEVRN
jgi:hypothetical protein